MMLTIRANMTLLYALIIAQYLSSITIVGYTMIPVFQAAVTTAAFLRFVVPVIPLPQWIVYNNELSIVLKPLHHGLASGILSPRQADEDFNIALVALLSQKPGFIDEAKN